MAILQTCCCWNNVRTGSLASGIYICIMSLINGGLIGYNLVHLNSYASETHWMQMSTMFQMAHGWFAVTLSVCVVQLIVSVILIIGIHKDNRFTLIPWVFIMIIAIVVDTAALIYECVVFGLLTFNIIQMVIWLGITLLNIYCVLCVVSQYQELKAGRGTQEYLQRNRATIVYHPGFQHVRITQGPIVVAYPGLYPNTGMVTSTTQVSQGATGQPTVTATTVIMSPPDYSVVGGQLPKYTPTVGAENSGASSTEAQDGSNTTSTTTTEEDTSRLIAKNESELPPKSPPPPYSP